MSDIKKQKRVAIQKEMAALEHEGGGHDPMDVVQFARANPDSALHSEFPWDIEKAAMEHWLNIARHLIVEYVVVYEKTAKEVILANVVSVPSLRKQGGASFRKWDDIDANEQWRQECLQEQIGLLRTKCLEWRSRLPELEKVWKAIASIK